MCEAGCESGVKQQGACQLLPATDRVASRASVLEEGASGRGGDDGMREKQGDGWLLCWFLHRHFQFRLPEISALRRVEKMKSMSVYSDATVDVDKVSNVQGVGEGEDVSSWLVPIAGVSQSPFWMVRLNDMEAKAICSRARLIKGMYRIFAKAGSLDELVEQVKMCDQEKDAFRQFRKCDGQCGECPESVSGQFTSRSWKMNVSAFGRSIHRQEQFQIMSRFSFLNFHGPVKMDNPENSFYIIQDNSDANESTLPGCGKESWFFCIEVASTDRSVASSMNLSKRLFIGPTSMDPDMSFIMCNHAGIRRGSFVFDPFVGTGSILVSAAHLGAVTVGMDIDIRMLLSKDTGGKPKKFDMWDNFQEYGLQEPVGLIRGDVSMPSLRENVGNCNASCAGGYFDAIICDPPYGVRAGGRKSGGRRKDSDGNLPYVIDPEQRDSHIPSTKPYPIGECFLDLLDLAARHLIVGGRLVFFLPCSQAMYNEEDDVPSHPMLKVISNCEQILSKYHSRRLITMEKIVDYDCDVAIMYRKKHESAISQRLEKHAEDLTMHSKQKKDKGDNSGTPRSYPGFRNKNF